MRKIRWRILPFVFVLYIVAFLDRANVAFAKLEMARDLGFSEAVYGFGAGVFFVGYLLLEIPGGMIVQKYGARRWFSRILLSWGLCTILVGFASSPTQFYLARFVLGVAEAGFFPGVIVYLNQWFPSRYRGRAMARFVMAIPVSLAVGGPISGFILKLQWLELPGWRWVFILEGIPAIILGVVTLFYLTDLPQHAEWLRPEEKMWLHKELEVEKERKIANVNVTPLQALRQRGVLVLALMTFLANIGGQGFFLWLPTTLQKASGYSSQLASAVSGIPFALGIASLFFFSWSTDRFQERYWHTALPLMLGGCIFPLTAIPDLSFGWLLGWMCVSSFLFYGYIPSYWVLTTLTLSEGAAAAAVGFINCFSALGGFTGPTVIGFLLTSGIPFGGVIFLIALSYLLAGSLTFALKPSVRLLSAFCLFCLCCSSVHAEQPRLRVCLISGSNEYHSDVSLSRFKKDLETRYNIRCELIQASGKLNQFGEFSELPGLESIEHADVVLLFVRRMTLSEEQLNKIKDYVDSGKPIVALRTASHGFQGWPEFDRTVLGGNYQGHYGTTYKQSLMPVETFRDHPVLVGVEKMISSSSLYKTAPVAVDAQVLMTSSTPESTQPAVWTRTHKGGRIFYTSLGSPDDFQDPSFHQLLTNAIFWAGDCPNRLHQDK